MIDVTIVLLEGGLPSTSLVPLEIFSCAGSLWGMLMGTSTEPRFRVRTATVDGKKASHFVPITLEPMMSLADVSDTDLVLIPTAGMDLAAARVRNAKLVEWLADRESKCAVAGVCTGVSLLAAAGLLDDREATTHWGVVSQCRAMYPQVQWSADRFVTETGNIICGGGLYASIDLSLYLVERYCGHGVAVQTAKALLLEAPRIWQSTHAAEPPRSGHGDAPIERAQKWLVENFRKPVDMDALASIVGMSPRNFVRRFKTATSEAPLNYLHRLRIDAAKQELESGHASMREICQAVGYEDVAFFRDLFRRHTGASPRDYRTRFGPRRTV